SANFACFCPLRAGLTLSVPFRTSWRSHEFLQPDGRIMSLVSDFQPLFSQMEIKVGENGPYPAADCSCATLANQDVESSSSAAHHSTMGDSSCRTTQELCPGTVG